MLLPAIRGLNYLARTTRSLGVAYATRRLSLIVATRTLVSVPTRLSRHPALQDSPAGILNTLTQRLRRLPRTT